MRKSRTFRPEYVGLEQRVSTSNLPVHMVAKPPVYTPPPHQGPGPGSARSLPPIVLTPAKGLLGGPLRKIVPTDVTTKVPKFGTATLYLDDYIYADKTRAVDLAIMLLANAPLKSVEGNVSLKRTAPDGASSFAVVPITHLTNPGADSNLIDRGQFKVNAGDRIDASALLAVTLTTGKTYQIKLNASTIVK